MGIIDILFLIILVIAFLSGMQKGLITSALACVAMVGAFLLAIALEGSLAKSFEGSQFYVYLTTSVDQQPAILPADLAPNWLHTLSFVIVFVLSYAALMLIVNLINNVFRMPKLKALDGVLGGVLGLVRGYAVICFTVAAAKILLAPLENESGSFINEMLNKSVMGKFFNSGTTLADLFGMGKMLGKLGNDIPKLV